jgi:hypothetical protein
MESMPRFTRRSDSSPMTLHCSRGSHYRIPQEIPLATGVPCEIGGSAFPRMTPPYEPPFTVTPRVLDLVVRISEEIGRQGWSRETSLTPALRRGNRLRSIQASLAIENNSLSLDQVTAVIAGKRVLGPQLWLSALLSALGHVPVTDPVTAPVSDPVKALLKVLGRHTLSAAACMEKLGLSHRATFRQNYLQPALDAGLIERTHPDKPNSRLQKYRRKNLL